MKRPKMKPGVLQSWFGKPVDDSGAPPDLNYQYCQPCERSDMRVLHQYLSPLLEELQQRGYDSFTFKFECKKKETQP